MEVINIPNYKTHLVIGIILSIVLAIVLSFNGYSINYWGILYIIIIAVIYSLLPDLDSPSSKIRMWFWLFLMIAIFYMAISKNFLGIIIGTGIGLVILYLSHRSENKMINLHDYITGVVLSVPVMFFEPIFGLFAFVSYTSHLILDSIIKN